MARQGHPNEGQRGKVGDVTTREHGVTSFALVGRRGKMSLLEPQVRSLVGHPTSAMMVA